MAKPVSKPNVGSSFAPGRKGNRTIGVFEKEKDEFYETPAALTRGLLAFEHFEGDIWEPACGQGAMSSLMAEAGYKVISTDLVDRGVGESKVDFLKEQRLRAPNVVTNPPFTLWGAFAERALKLGANKVVLLNRAAVLSNQRTSDLMMRTGLARVLIAAGRVKMLPPGAVDLGYSPRNGDFAWFVWERGHSGPPSVQWFSPRHFGYGKTRAGATASVRPARQSPSEWPAGGP